MAFFLLTKRWYMSNKERKNSDRSIITGDRIRLLSARIRCKKGRKYWSGVYRRNEWQKKL